MKKKLLAVICIAAMAITTCACGAKKVVTCSKCGKEMTVPADQFEGDGWIIFCADCEPRVVSPQ